MWVQARHSRIAVGRRTGAGGAVTWDSGVLVNTALTNLNLTATCNSASGSGNGTRSTTSHSNGKYYVEITFTNDPGGVTVGIGVADSVHTIGSSFVGGNTHSTGWYNTNPRYFNGADLGQMQAQTYTTGDIIGMCIDLDVRKNWWRKNNLGVFSPVNGAGDPVANVGGQDLSTFATNVYVAVDFEGANGAAFTANFGPSFAFVPPSGFGSW